MTQNLYGIIQIILIKDSFLLFLIADMNDNTIA